MQEFVVKSPLEMVRLGERFAREFGNGGVLTLSGDLGSGKTTFAQGFAKGLGVGQRIISPTFVIVRKYDNKIKKKALFFKCLYHIDLYRVENESELEGLGLKEILADASNVVLIEWAERLGGRLSEKRTELKFEWVSESERSVKVWNQEA